MNTIATSAKWPEPVFVNGFLINRLVESLLDRAQGIARCGVPWAAGRLVPQVIPPMLKVRQISEFERHGA